MTHADEHSHANEARKGSSRSRRIAHAGRWSVYFLLVGLIAGGAAIVFQYLCQGGMYLFMDLLAGYRPPSPAGEEHLFPAGDTPLTRWLLLLLPAAGGLIAGWLVYTFAPEAEGHGTDAAIDAYHRKGGFIRARVPFVKTIASVLTMTTGGSGGREGPISQIGAGFGSFLATRLKLSDRDRRILLAAGIAAGVGSIFRAPLAGALFAAEVLYRNPEFESDVIIPAGIASVVAYCVFCLVFGWGSLFEAPAFHFQNPVELGPYIVLAFVLAGMGIFFIKMFYGVTRLFRALTIPRHLKPAIGGLCTGVVGFFLPHTLAFGYGFVQEALFLKETLQTGLPIQGAFLFLFSLAVGKILTTSFSIGSGGSGGLFGPSVVIGGASGGLVGLAFHQIVPGIVTEPGAFVIVGMAGFLAAVSNTPISAILFVGEMTNSYQLLLPSLLVCSLAYALSKNHSLYEKQPRSRIDSPAHSGEFLVDILQTFTVEDLMDQVRSVSMIPRNMLFSEFKRYFSTTKQHYFPVMDENRRLVGIFSSTDIRGVLFSPEIESLVVMEDLTTTDIIITTPSEDLNTVLQKFTVKNIDSLPVVSENDHGILLGMLNRREVIAFYNRRVQETREKKSVQAQ